MDQFESGFFVGQSAWHNKGAVLAEPPRTTEEAMRVGQLDWTVDPQPVYATVCTPEGVRNVACPDHRAMVRSSDKRVLSVMGKDYTPLQNVEGFRFFDPFLHEGDAHLEAAGSLKGGRVVWVLAKLSGNGDTVGVPGDVVNPYLLLSNAHDGSSAVRVAFTAIRVVCWNTLSAAHGETKDSSARVRHGVKVAENVKAVRNCIDLARQDFGVTMDLLRGMREQQISIPMLRNYVRNLLASPQKLVAIAEAESRGFEIPKVRGEDDIVQSFFAGPGADMAGQTAYGAYNAVTHYLDHVRGSDADARMHSSWFGQGARVRDRALQLAATGQGFE